MACGSANATTVARARTSAGAATPLALRRIRARHALGTAHAVDLPELGFPGELEVLREVCRIDRPERLMGALLDGHLRVHHDPNVAEELVGGNEMSVVKRALEIMP